ncbi:unnamed protein product [Rhodiola kirilowii]
MMAWPTPRNIRELRGFLGLTGYYRKFIHGYGLVVQPLTKLLKKDGFRWSSEAELAFSKLKVLLSNAPVLAYPDFSHHFTLETDASQYGIGAVLAQKERPIAYMSEALGPRNAGLPVYEKELLAVLSAVTRWKHYLEGTPYVIKTNHQSLRFLLDQKLNTNLQRKGISRLMGLDFTIEYRRGFENKAADALSRLQELKQAAVPIHAELCAISSIVPSWKIAIEASYESDASAQQLIRELGIAPNSHVNYKFQNGVLRYKGRLYVGNSGGLRDEIIHQFHDAPIGGHSGRLVTYKKVNHHFYWPGLKTQVVDYVARCDTCQRCKGEHVATPGLLEPLPIPQGVWKDIAMDFVDGLPKSKGKYVILVVVDRFSKYGHFIALSHPYTAIQVAHNLLDNVFKLHGLPETIVSDRDKIFTNNVWRELFHCFGTKLHLSSAYHPQSDGQIGRLNQCLKHYLRAMCFRQPAHWSKWLSMAEFWYNSAYHSALKCSLFEVLYGYPPPSVPRLKDEQPSVAVVTEFATRHAQMTRYLTESLKQAQNRMKVQADKSRSEREFCVGDLVFLKFQPYKQTSLAVRSSIKLAAKYYGPYRVLAKVGSVAYKLELPHGCLLHPVFHVSLLKKCIGDEQMAVSSPPLTSEEGQMKSEPEAILSRRLVKHNNQAVVQVLIKWANLYEDEATWEDYNAIKSQFPQVEKLNVCILGTRIL